MDVDHPAAEYSHRSLICWGADQDAEKSISTNGSVIRLNVVIRVIIAATTLGRSHLAAGTAFRFIGAIFGARGTMVKTVEAAVSADTTACGTKANRLPTTA